MGAAPSGRAAHRRCHPFHRARHPEAVRLPAHRAAACRSCSRSSGSPASSSLVGGFLLLIGLFTRPVAFVLSGQMAFAYWMAHAPQSTYPVLNGGDAAILFCFLFLYLAAAGAGRLQRRRRARRRAAERCEIAAGRLQSLHVARLMAACPAQPIVTRRASAIAVAAVVGGFTFRRIIWPDAATESVVNVRWIRRSPVGGI